jgi:murein DD-endopeptidase MepM/ murein hydrolase activator NlpD
MADNKKNKTNLKSKLTKKFRLVVLNEDSFEERFSFKLTRLNVFVLGGVFSVLLIGLTVLLIAFTPIKEYIPGFSSTKLKKQATDLFYKVDSLQIYLKKVEKFTSAMRPILIGEDDTLNLHLQDIVPPSLSSEKLLVMKTINSDSINKVISSIRFSIDSSWQARFQKEKEQLEIDFRKTNNSVGAAKDSLYELNEKFNLELSEKNNSLEKLKSDLAKNETQIASLNKQITQKNIEIRKSINSLSKENKDVLQQAKIDTEQAKQEVLRQAKIEFEKEKRELIKSSDAKIVEVKNELEGQFKISSKNKEQAIRKELLLEFAQKEKNWASSHTDEMRTLNQNLFSREAIIDSLIHQVAFLKQKPIGEVGKIPFAEVIEVDEKLLVASEKDSIFREEVEREDRFSLFDFESGNEDVVFFAPVKGIITEDYNVKEKHYAVDVAVTKGAAVKSVADGTVVFAEWTAETGYVMIIEHKNRYLSVYKHNEIIYRKQGDLVKTGEVISKAGSSGEYSTGPHLHFEMWFQGYPVNPINFIEFE